MSIVVVLTVVELAWRAVSGCWYGTMDCPHVVGAEVCIYGPDRIDNCHDQGGGVLHYQHCVCKLGSRTNAD